MPDTGAASGAGCGLCAPDPSSTEGAPICGLEIPIVNLDEPTVGEGRPPGFEGEDAGARPAPAVVGGKTIDMFVKVDPQGLSEECWEQNNTALYKGVACGQIPQ